MRRLAFVLTVLTAFAVPAFSSASVSAVSVVKISAPASGMRYDQKSVHARAGRIKVVFLNRSAMKHNVNIESGEHELGRTATIAHGATTMFVTLKTGTYNFYCSVPGHEAAGMRGTLIVS